jgi:hypothetical protein
MEQMIVLTSTLFPELVAPLGDRIDHSPYDHRRCQVALSALFGFEQGVEPDFFQRS